MERDTHGERERKKQTYKKQTFYEYIECQIKYMYTYVKISQGNTS